MSCGRDWCPIDLQCCHHAVNAIDPSCDMFLLHDIDGEDAIIGGAYADLDILSFMPHLRTLVR